jgi:hypothetical protein
MLLGAGAAERAGVCVAVTRAVVVWLPGVDAVAVDSFSLSPPPKAAARMKTTTMAPAIHRHFFRFLAWLSG